MGFDFFAMFIFPKNWSEQLSASATSTSFGETEEYYQTRKNKNWTVDCPIKRFICMSQKEKYDLIS
jgi:hypothetical protein